MRRTQYNPAFSVTVGLVVKIYFTATLATADNARTQYALKII